MSHPILQAVLSHLYIAGSALAAAVCRLHQSVQAVLDVLERVSETAKDIPPVDNKASRFGNPAFRKFYDKVSEVRRIHLLVALTNLNIHCRRC